MSTEEFNFLVRFPLLFQELRFLESCSNSVPLSSAVNIHKSNKLTPLALSYSKKKHKELRHIYLAG